MSRSILPTGNTWEPAGGRPSAGTDISGASNPKADGAITGTFNPGGVALLSAFDGEDASGVWRLTITDDSGGDSGTLFGWSLFVTY